MYRGASRFFQQLIDHLFDFPIDGRSLPIELALPPKADVALFVDDVNGWPHRIAPSVPVLFLDVDQDGEAKTIFGRRDSNFFRIFFR